MPEKDTIYSSSVKYSGLLLFSDFYKFCYDWLTEETELLMMENKYKEKLAGDAKELEIEWRGFRKITDYFKFDIKVNFEVRRLTEVEVSKDGKKINMNKGDVKISVKGTLVRDYAGKFEASWWRKFVRSIYEKWVISSRTDQMEGKVIGDCDEFLNQAKAYLDLLGRR